jgi:hypothetical protein
MFVVQFQITLSLDPAQFAFLKQAFGSVQQSLSTIQSNQKQEILKMAALDDQIAALTADVTAETTVNASAVTLINGIPALIQAAVNNALAAGATPAELTALTSLATQINQSSGSLAAAVTANTAPVAPAPPPAPGA